MQKTSATQRFGKCCSKVKLAMFFTTGLVRAFIMLKVAENFLRGHTGCSFTQRNLTIEPFWRTPQLVISGKHGEAETHQPTHVQCDRQDPRDVDALVTFLIFAPHPSLPGLFFRPRRPELPCGGQSPPSLVHLFPSPFPPCGGRALGGLPHPHPSTHTPHQA